MQVTSALRTKKGESSLPRMSRARASGPAVYQLVLQHTATHVRCADVIGREAKEGGTVGGGGLTRAQRLCLNRERDANPKLLLGLLQDGHHDLWSVVDSQDDVLDSGLWLSAVLWAGGRYEAKWGVGRLTLTRASIWCKLGISMGCICKSDANDTSKYG